MSEPSIFFVCGAPKSGTTWLQKLLDAHPNVTCSGEGHFVERLMMPMSKLAVDYNTHLDLVATRVYQGAPYYTSLPQPAWLASVRSLMLAMMGARAAPDTKAMGDKTPRYTHHLRELSIPFPECRFISITRDPRDVAVSRLNHALRAGMDDALTVGSAAYLQLLANAASAWTEAQERLAAFAGTSPERLLELRYEELLDAPEACAALAFEHLGVRNDQEVTRRAVESSSFAKLSGRERGVEDKTSFFRKGVAGDWLGVLDKEGLSIVENGCAAMMRRSGYAPGRPPTA